MSGGVPAGELLPCPFCGGVGDIESQPSYCQAANTYDRYRGWCDQCGFGLDWHGHETDAITAWNTRATPTPPIEGRDADVERVARAICLESISYRGIAELRYADQIVDDEWEDYVPQARAALQALGERP